MLGINVDVGLHGPNVTAGLGNFTGNFSHVATTIKDFAGNWAIVIGAIVLIVGFFLFLKFLKNIIANAVIGVIGLLILKYVLGVPVPLTNPLVLLIVVIAGIPGLAVVLLAIFFNLL